MIILERSHPEAEKTIRPLALGGQAGGAKYLVNGILFKFADDAHGWYGGIEQAKKASNLDLLGCAATFGSRIPGIHVPLVALIAFRGFVLTAQSHLPIHPAHTLVVGSSDGGQHVVAREPRASRAMERLGRALNLRHHQVSDVWLWGPFDLEGHRSVVDNRLYLLDFARLFPPEWPGPDDSPSSHLFELLRPELVRTHPVPLCSDALASVCHDDSRRTLARDLHDATQRLYRFVIPQCAHWLVHAGSCTPEQYAWLVAFWIVFCWCV